MLDLDMFVHDQDSPSASPSNSVYIFLFTPFSLALENVFMNKFTSTVPGINSMSKFHLSNLKESP